MYCFPLYIYIYTVVVLYNLLIVYIPRIYLNLRWLSIYWYLLYNQLLIQYYILTCTTAVSTTTYYSDTADATTTSTAIASMLQQLGALKVITAEEELLLFIQVGRSTDSSTDSSDDVCTLHAFVLFLSFVLLYNKLCCIYSTILYTYTTLWNFKNNVYHTLQLLSH